MYSQGGSPRHRWRLVGSPGTTRVGIQDPKGRFETGQTTLPTVCHTLLSVASVNYHWPYTRYIWSTTPLVKYWWSVKLLLTTQGTWLRNWSREVPCPPKALTEFRHTLQVRDGSRIEKKVVVGGGTLEEYRGPGVEQEEQLKTKEEPQMERCK